MWTRPGTNEDKLWHHWYQRLAPLVMVTQGKEMHIAWNIIHEISGLLELLFLFWLWSHEGMDLPWWPSGWRTCLKFRRHRRGVFDTWVKKILWTRYWQPALVFLLGESHRQRSLAGCSPWRCKESDMTEWLTFLPTSVYICKVINLLQIRLV